VLELLAASSGIPVASAGFAGVVAGTVSPAAFFAPGDAATNKRGEQAA
jgi:hypothetical protein